MLKSLGESVALILGASAIILGSFGVVLFKGSWDMCHDGEVEAGLEYFCESIAPWYLISWFVVAFGISALLLYAVFSIRRRKATINAQTICPQCGTTIHHQSSPSNCANCGVPIDWARLQNLQK